jgi:eukaryotic-like serine/threonine-protein kinase
MGNPLGPSPFERNPFGGSEPFATQQPPQPPPTPRDEANVLATLSLVFAFVFAPAGAILGHLGLRQIRRSGGRGRDRALVGLTLSYVFITAAVVALVISATLANTSQTRVAAPSTTTTTARTATATTTTPPPAPAVAPADLDGLLPTLDDVRNFTGDSGLTLHATSHQLTDDPDAPSLDRPECLAVMEDSAPEAYDVPAIAGDSESDFRDTRDRHNGWVVGEGVSAFHDGTAAQAQLAKLQSIWRQCGGSTAHQTYPNRGTYQTTMTPPADAGNGITTMETVTEFPSISSFGVRAIAAKANVVIDVGAWSTSSIARRREVALAIANYILGKIPG